MSLPAGFAQAGFASTGIMLFASAALSCFTMHLLTIVSRKVGQDKASFYAVAHETMPNKAWLVEVAVIISCFGLASAYLVAFAQLMPAVVGTPGSSVATNQYLWVAIGLAIAAPMAFAPTLDALKLTSSGGMVSTVYLASVSVFYYMQPNDRVCSTDDSNNEAHCGGAFVAFKMGPSVLTTLSLVTFSFTAHIQLMAVSNEVPHRCLTFVAAGVLSKCAFFLFSPETNPL